MNQTTNFSLGKPLEDEMYDISIQNNNMDIIDVTLKEASDTASGASSGLSFHTANKNNPHEVTKAQIGLGNVDNTADAEKTVAHALTADVALSVPTASTATTAKTADKLSVARTITLGNHVTGSAKFDGSGDITINVSVKNDSHQHSISGIVSLRSELDGKQPLLKLDANKVVITSGAGNIMVSPITSSELYFLDGVTSNVQTQLNNVNSIISKYEGLGQLGAPVAIEAENEDLDDYVTEGIYAFSQYHTPLKAPELSVNGWLIVIPWSKTFNDTCKQIWLRHGSLGLNDFKIYVRTKIDEVWSDWTEIITNKSNLVYKFSLSDNLIARGDDLDNYTEIGSYRATGTDIALEILNSPTAYNYRLDVEFLSSNNYIIQTVIDRNANTYRRCCDLTTSTWTEWKTL